MFRKAILVALFVLVLMAGSSYAESIDISTYINMLPNAIDKLETRQGVGYDFINDEIDYLTTVKIVEWKGIMLEAGYATPFNQFASDNKAVVAVTKNLLSLKEMGVTLPILDLIQFDVGAYITYSRLSIGLGDGKEGNEFGAGAAVTGIIKLKW